MNKFFKRVAIFQLVIGILCESTIAATCERGSRLISEAGGAGAIAGTAAPEEAPSLAGVVGISDPNQVSPFEFIPTVPGAPGILDFADFYAIMPTDNPNPIPGGGAVQFPRTGSTNGGIKRVESFPFTFELPIAGTYLILFQASVTNGGQLLLRFNTNPSQPQSVVGRSTGNTQIVSFGLVTTVADHSIVSVINPPGNAPITLTPNAGGNQPVTAHLIIIRIQ